MKNNFSLTQNAVKRLNHLIAQESANAKLRILVEAGGCSGFQYKFNLINDEPGQEDLLIEQDGALVVIDNISLNFLNGAKLDFVESLGESFFEIISTNRFRPTMTYS